MPANPYAEPASPLPGPGPARVRDWAPAEITDKPGPEGREMTAAETAVVGAIPMRIQCWTGEGLPDMWWWGPDLDAGDDAWSAAGCQPWQIASGTAATKRAARSKAVKEGRRR